MLRTLLRTLLVTLAMFFIGIGVASAGGGRYVFNGGTPQQRTEVTAALQASSFPWSIVPQQIVINIAAGIALEATVGQIWLDSNLVDSGTFAWAIIQHEYAHQVDFLLFTDATRSQLLRVLGGRAWCGAVPGYDHADYGCERFASTLTWAFWQSDANSLQPIFATDESAAMAPNDFKALLGRILKVPGATAVRLLAAHQPYTTPDAPGWRPSANGHTRALARGSRG